MSRKKILIIYLKKPGGEYVVTKNLCRKIEGFPKLTIKVKEIKDSTFALGKRFRFLKQITLNLLFFFHALRKISPAQAEKINYIYSPSPTALFLALFFRRFKTAKLIYHFHGFEYGEDNKTILEFVRKEKINPIVKYFYLLPLLYLFFFLMGFVLKKAWKIFVPAGYSRALILRKYPSVQKEKIAVVPNGYDKKFFYPAQKVSKTSQNRVLYVGRLAKEKGIEELVKAFDLLNDKKYHLTLLCWSVRDTELEKKIKGFLSGRDNIKIFMNFAPEKVADCYHRSGLTILPSKSYFEQLPLVYLESLACGTPMLISDKIPGILAWQRKVAPTLILSRITPKEIAFKIKEFFNFPERSREIIRRRCLKFSKKFSWEESFKVFLDQVLNEGALDRP